MKVTEHQNPPAIDLLQRFRDEIKGLPPQVSLVGNAMQVEIAERLLAEHGITNTRGESVQLASMEQFGSAFLESFMEKKDPPKGRFLFHTIPEAELIAFAKRHDIPVVHEERSHVRFMLDRIAQKQPQTYFSLSRSSERLRAAAELLRTGQEK